MKKLLLFFLMIGLCLSQVFSVSLIYEQSRVLADYNIQELGFTKQDFINTNEVIIGNVQTNFTYNYASKQNILNNPIYFYFNNPCKDNKTKIDIGYTTNLPLAYVLEKNITSNIFTNQELILNEQGTYYFEIKPNYKGENVDYFININTSNCAITSNTIPLYIEEKKSYGALSSIMSFMLLSNTVIDYNLGLWHLVYILYCIGIIVSFMALIIYLIYYFVHWGFEMRKRRRKIMGGSM